MNYDTIRNLLSDYDSDQVDVYLNYIHYLANERDRKTKQLKNDWVNRRPDQYFADCFKAVVKDGLDFDGKHITLQSTGISYSYIAFKNKMLKIYPESLIDVQLVREGDSFRFSKESGHVKYQHEIANPFGHSEVIGAYCVIKNSRGQFLTTLSREEIDKHRQVAKQDFIWASWFDEMALKTIIKKAVKNHFNDTFSNIETLDNTQYDLDQPLDISLETKRAIEDIATEEDLKKYYLANKGANAGVLEGFTNACALRKEAIKKMMQEAAEAAEQEEETERVETNGNN